MQTLSVSPIVLFSKNSLYMIELGNSLPLSPFTIRKAKKANWFWKTLDYKLRIFYFIIKC